MAATGRPVQELRVDGGATANSWLMQFQADVTGIPVEVAAETETTALGAAYLAGLTIGIWNDYPEIDRLRRSGRRFEPTWSVSQRNDLYARWQEARRALTPLGSPGMSKEVAGCLRVWGVQLEGLVRVGAAQ